MHFVTKLPVDIIYTNKILEPQCIGPHHKIYKIMFIMRNEGVMEITLWSIQTATTPGHSQNYEKVLTFSCNNFKVVRIA